MTEARTAGKLQADEIAAYYRTVAPYYDHELVERGDEALWSALGREHAGDWVLELGAGTGRATARLAGAGASVVGLDLSAEMLARGRERLAGRDGVHLVQADMRAFAFRRRFDLVVAADDPFSHLTADRDRDRALWCAAAALAPGGRFVLDALWFPDSELARLAVGRRSERSLPFHGRTLRVCELWRRDGGGPICRAEYTYRLDGRIVARAAFRARAWTRDELERRLSRAGLAAEQWWGEYDRRPWNESSSERLVVVAVRSPHPDPLTDSQR
jgi:SAM-dependent methyltransferase